MAKERSELREFLAECIREVEKIDSYLTRARVLGYVVEELKNLSVPQGEPDYRAIPIGVLAETISSVYEELHPSSPVDKVCSRQTALGMFIQQAVDENPDMSFWDALAFAEERRKHYEDHSGCG
jgi:hypothetical protein